jgi:hypothetical protein
MPPEHGVVSSNLTGRAILFNDLVPIRPDHPGDSIAFLPGLLGDLAKHVIEDRKSDNTSDPDRARGNENQTSLAHTPANERDE